MNDDNLRPQLSELQYISDTEIHTKACRDRKKKVREKKNSFWYLGIKWEESKLRYVLGLVEKDAEWAAWVKEYDTGYRIEKRV